MDKLKLWRIVGVFWGMRSSAEDNNRKLSDFVVRISDIAGRYVENSVYFKEVLDLLREINEHADSIKEEYSELQDMVNKLTDEIRNR